MFQNFPRWKMNIAGLKALVIWRTVLISIYLISMWYDIRFVGLNFDKKLKKLNLFMHGRFYLLTYWLGVRQTDSNFCHIV